MKKLMPLIFLLVVSCEVVPLEPVPEPPPIVAAGRVVDRVTGEPLPGVTVSVLSRSSDGFFGPSHENEFGARPVANDGSFEFHLSRGGNYTIRAFSEEQIAYGEQNTGPPFVDARKGVPYTGNSNLVLRMSPTAWLVITPRTDRPLGPRDEFTLSINGWPAGVRNQPAPSSRLVAGETVKIAWHVRRNGVTDDGAINLAIQRHTVNEYTLDY